MTEEELNEDHKIIISDLIDNLTVGDIYYSEDDFEHPVFSTDKEFRYAKIYHIHKNIVVYHRLKTDDSFHYVEGTKSDFSVLQCEDVEFVKLYPKLTNKVPSQKLYKKSVVNIYLKKEDYEAFKIDGQPRNVEIFIGSRVKYKPDEIEKIGEFLDYYPDPRSKEVNFDWGEGVWK